MSHTPCASVGYIDYLHLFYCGFVATPAAGYAAFLLWLVVFFYLLGGTASEYLCAPLKGLYVALRLPPAVAGITLLSLGNGAPDVFASVVSFAAGDSGDGGCYGLNCALGGALFVSIVVAGVVALAPQGAAAGEGSSWRCHACITLCARSACRYTIRATSPSGISDIATHRWSRPCGVASVALAPVLLATTWTSHSPMKSSLRHHNSDGHAILLAGAVLDLLLAALLEATTGVAIAVKANMLGVTVLAWGDSMGDLVSNMAMATHGGPTARRRPTRRRSRSRWMRQCTRRSTRDMRLDRVYRVGLIIIYLTFLGVRVLDSRGLWFG
ncbi:hypothetical protein VPH35_053173 [Triticum aestivum]|uniref:Sodium/calcium exchanger membrane region domain-containing protein n=1 Tax=Triticum aestivum TaxID=4565 RepID=A0A077S3T9_WHEAT|nr:unnamed protein product [Triticum aestivum]